MQTFFVLEYNISPSRHDDMTGHRKVMTSIMIFSQVAAAKRGCEILDSLDTMSAWFMYLHQVLCICVCLPVFSAEPYNDTSYNATDPYGGESLPVWTITFPVHLSSHVPQ